MEGPEILTRRLRLSPLTASDAPAMYEYRSDPEICRYQSFEPGSLEEVEDLIEGQQHTAFDTAGTWFQFAVRQREDGGLVGDIGTHFLAGDPRQVEIGFTVSPKYQGRGYGTEAVNGVLGHLFGPLGKHRVFASVDPENKSSIALLKRVGMRQEAHHRKSFWFKGVWVDDLVFGILGTEFGKGPMSPSGRSQG